MQQRRLGELDEKSGFDYVEPLDMGLGRYQRSTENVMHRLLDRDGLEPPEQRAVNPDGSYFDGRLPSGWSNYQGKDLAALFELMTRHADFVGTKLTYAKAEYTNAEERLRLVRAHVRRTKKGTNEGKEDETIVDSRYVQANAEWLEASEYRDLLQAIYDAAGRDLRILSRVLETTKQEFGAGQRLGSLGRDPFKR